MALNAVQVPAVFGPGMGSVVFQMTGHALGTQALIHALPMTSDAIKGAMNPQERKARHGVLEFRNLPEMLSVALLASQLSSAMDIILLMTGETLLTCSSQLSSILVAFSALQGVVNTRKREVFVEVTGELPPFFRMAFFALLGEAPFVGILVAFGATHPQGLEVNQCSFSAFVVHRLASRFVALTALEFQMLELQRETTLIVIKLRRLPSFVTMALIAAGPQLTGMVILMAIHATNAHGFEVSDRLGDPLHEHGLVRRLVAFFTLERGMLVQQRKTTLFDMIELRRLPDRFRVALSAARTQLSRVHVLVTSQTGFLLEIGVLKLSELETVNLFFSADVRPLQCDHSRRRSVTAFALSLFVSA